MRRGTRVSAAAEVLAEEEEEEEEMMEEVVVVEEEVAEAGVKERRGDRRMIGKRWNDPARLRVEAKATAGRVSDDKASAPR